MTRPIPRWLPFAILAAVLGLSSLAGWLDRVIFFSFFDIGLSAATAIVAASAYRSRRDPALIYVAIACAVLTAIDAIRLLFSIWVESQDFDLIENAYFRVGHASSLWVPLGWLTACICLAAAVPWRDRRGRRPVRPGAAISAIVGPLVLLLAIAVWSASDTATPDQMVGPSSLSLIKGLAVSTVFVAAIACYRALVSQANEAMLRWLAAAAVAFASVSAINSLVVQELSEGLFDGSVPGGAGEITSLLFMANTFLLLGVLASNKQEASRMRRATDRASEVMEGRAEIAATIAHDVRGPVGTIKGLATTTRKSYDRLGDPERLEFIGMIEQESGRLLRLVDQVAMGLKIDAGALDLHRRLQDIGPMLVHARTQVETTRTVAIETPDGLEAPIDTRWYSEAVAQGIDNALRFSPPESSVEVHARLVGAGVIVDIVDHGPGIPADQREALFEKFSRWRPVGYDDRTGTGLGLFICRGIARAHGGDATLDEAPGGGTMLRILVPAEEKPT